MVQRQFGSERFESAMELYKMVHSPLVLSICSFGILANVLLLIVLNRKNMLGPTNILLTGLSFAQLCLLANFFCYSIYNMFDEEMSSGYTRSYSMMVYVMLNVNLNIVFHTIALVHTTLLAVFRYLAIGFPTRFKRFISVSGARATRLATYLSVPILCLPIFCSTILVPVSEDEGPSNRTKSVTYRLRLREEESKALIDFNFWFFGIVCKVVPCLSLSVLSFLLVHKMRRAQDRRKILTGRGSSSGNTRRKNVVEEKNHRRVTIMLLLVVLFFLLVELPQGILNLLAGAYSKRFRHEIYWHVADFFEMLTVLYSSINFVLYCAMSSQFRAAFKDTFGPCLGLGACGRFIPWGHKTTPLRLMDRGSYECCALIQSSNGTGLTNGTTTTTSASSTVVLDISRHKVQPAGVEL